MLVAATAAPRREERDRERREMDGARAHGADEALSSSRQRHPTVEPSGSMRTTGWSLLATLSLALMGAPRGALAALGAGARAIEAANAALGADPPNREAALAALAEAISVADEPEAVSEAYVLRGRLDEEGGAYEAALADDRAALAAAPNTRWALRASVRAEWLLARSEGRFEPLRRLESLRQDPARANDASAVAALERDAESFPPGMVRVEARMFVAEAYLGRLHRTGDADVELRRVVNDPRAPALTVRLAERELVDALSGEGRFDDAAAEARANAAQLDPGFAKRIARLARRRIERLVAYGVLAMFGAMAGAALARAQRRGVLRDAGRAIRRVAPVSAAFVAFAALAGGALASNYERGNAAPFWLLGLAVLPLILLARAWSAVGSRTRAVLVLRVVLSGARVLAAAFARLDGWAPADLEGVGL